MRTRPGTLVCLFLAVIGVGAAGLAGPNRAVQGKFYIVGMGTAPDLITIRAAEVVKSGDIVLVENEQEQDMWKDHIRNKEVWFCPQSIVRRYGIDPETVKDAQQRALVEKGIKIRQAMVDRIRSALDYEVLR